MGFYPWPPCASLANQMGGSTSKVADIEAGLDGVQGAKEATQKVSPVDNLSDAQLEEVRLAHRTKQPTTMNPSVHGCLVPPLQAFSNAGVPRVTVL